MSIVVQAEALEKTYQAGNVAVPAVRGMDFAIEAGACVAFVGPSGAAKIRAILRDKQNVRMFSDGYPAAHGRSEGDTTHGHVNN